MPNYPGLGLELLHYPRDKEEFYPVGAHSHCEDSDSHLLPVREVAMMLIMDQLTDKPDWHKKVFDDDIVAKWRKEALEYPDKLLWRHATAGKSTPGVEFEDEDDEGAEENEHDNGFPITRENYGGLRPLKGIMSDATFTYVCTSRWTLAYRPVDPVTDKDPSLLVSTRAPSQGSLL
jgi:hypothetical protein